MNVPEQEARAELKRVLASKGFASAGRLSRLLRYVVDKTLAGDADQLKEYAVGVEVFDRDETYDPRLDAIVRVEAGRLRSRLDDYYNGEGANAPVRIALPRGAYVAHFERREPTHVAATIPAPAAPPTGWATWPLTVGLIAAVAGMVVWLAGSTPTPAETGAPGVAVLAFSGDDSALAARLTENLTSELARLGTVSVASHTSAMQYAGTRTSLREIASALNIDYAVEASVERVPDGLLVVLRIVDAATERKVWVSDYRGAPADVRAMAQRIAFDVGTEVMRRAR